MNKLTLCLLKVTGRMQLSVLRIRTTYALWKYARRVRGVPDDLIQAVPRPTYGATKGNRFTPIKSFPPTKALVYLYRYPGLVSFVYPIRVTMNGSELVKLRHGAYYPCYVEPGPIEFAAKNPRRQSNSLTLSVKAGGIYYFRATGFVLGQGAFTEISPQQAKAQLSECYMVPEKDIAGIV